MEEGKRPLLICTAPTAEMNGGVEKLVESEVTEASWCPRTRNQQDFSQTLFCQPLGRLQGVSQLDVCLTMSRTGSQQLEEIWNHQPA